MGTRAAAALLVLCCALGLSAADGPRFEAASIHPTPDNAPFFARPPSNGKFSGTGIVARLMIMLAYNVQESQISDGPSWMGTDRWFVVVLCVPGVSFCVVVSCL